MNQEAILYKQKQDFKRVKRYICKRFPGAYTEQLPTGAFKVVDGSGVSVVNEELMMPPTYTVLGAWHQAKYSAWFSNMINKSNRAFSDDKILRKLAKKLKD
tara:strand:+ start:1488 stop:1790 length:303 start_codon:yes stop_codon:yes gene_type:complete